MAVPLPPSEVGLADRYGGRFDAVLGTCLCRVVVFAPKADGLPGGNLFFRKRPAVPVRPPHDSRRLLPSTADATGFGRVGLAVRHADTVAVEPVVSQAARYSSGVRILPLISVHSHGAPSSPMP
jgi:hypothetical protein